VGGLIVAGIVGFLLGVLLMVFLVAGREEEELLNRVEKAERSRERTSRESKSAQEPVTNTREKGSSADHL
jgi:hypothetical protein